MKTATGLYTLHRPEGMFEKLVFSVDTPARRERLARKLPIGATVDGTFRHTLRGEGSEWVCGALGHEEDRTKFLLTPWWWAP